MNVAKDIGCGSLAYRAKGFRYSTWWGAHLVHRLAMAVLFFSIIFPQNIIHAQCIIACRSDLNISLGSNGQVSISPGFLLQDPDCDPNDFSVSITDDQGTSIGNQLDCSHVGQTVTARATHISSGNYCETEITVSDNFAPVLICTDTIVWCSSDAAPSQTGYPTMRDNCGFPATGDLSYADQFTDLACYSTYGIDSVTSKIDRIWTATDLNGNQSTCLQTIYLRRGTVDDVDFPAHLDDFNLSALDCSQDPTDLSLTGVPTIDGQPIEVGSFCELVVSSSDQIVPGCSPGGYNILRTWTVVDWCSGDFTLNVQIIKVKDSTAPEISCPADLTIATLDHICSATLTLPNASATDDCSGFTITPNWIYGSGYGPYTNVTPGVYPVTYTAEDDCGNRSDCTMNLTVVDQTPPTVVCDLNTQITLGGGNTVSIPAITFDDGSLDNCGIDRFEVSRDTLPFGPVIHFSCEDVARNPISIHLKVIDLSGNENSCEVLVTVTDESRPMITCPADLTLACTDNYELLSLTGEPMVSDNCGIDSVYYDDQLSLNSCGIGTVNRTWYATDQSGHSSFCTQLIHLFDTTPVEVYFPADLSIYTCGAATFPVVTGEPTVINNDCESMWEGYTDQVFDFAPPACSKILRTWEVFDWCIYDPNSGSTDGYWTHTQVISIFDLDAPEVTCPADVTVNSFADDCLGTFVTIDSLLATDCSDEIAISNNSPFAVSNGADASGTYPVGQHLITFIAEDGCGNTNSCQMRITVLDAKPPSPFCRAGLVTAIGPDGKASITPDLIDLGSSDNCTDTAQLLRTVFPMTFTCDDIGEQMVTLTVTDEAGNSATCTSIVQIQDGLGYCPTANIGGLILTEDGRAIPNMLVQLQSADTLSVRSDQDGYYLFSDQNKGDLYEIIPTKDTSADNGVTTFDVIMITRHILSIFLLDSPYKMIASDVNNSGTITTFDLVEMRKLILGIADTFSRNESWRFVDANFNFEDPLNPFSATFPESYTITDLQSDEYSIDFVGVKIGDVNASVDPAGLMAGEERSEGQDLLLTYRDTLLRPGKIHRLPFGLKNLDRLAGFQMSIGLTPFSAHIHDFTFGPLAHALSFDQHNISLHQIESGKINCSWNRSLAASNLAKEVATQPLFYLDVEVNEELTLTELLQFWEDQIRTESYWETASADAIIGGSIRYERASSVEEKRPLQVGTNYPNPFNQSTIIPLQIAQRDRLQLVLTDIRGRIVFREEKWVEKGPYEWSFDRLETGLNAGLYYYYFESKSGRSTTQKMLIQ